MLYVALDATRFVSLPHDGRFGGFYGPAYLRRVPAECFDVCTVPPCMARRA